MKTAAAAAPLTVCVYCASSDGAAPDYLQAAAQLGHRLAVAGYGIVYGGGRMGAMGVLADAALAAGGRVVGVMPDFLSRLELAHRSLSELNIVENMRVRKHEMLRRSSAVIALPGGVGTFEELLEAITLRKLGVHRHPIVIVNLNGYYQPLLQLLGDAQRERFLSVVEPLWTVVADVEAAVSVIAGVTA